MPNHDKELYLDSITFLVEDTLFKIPKHCFKTSTGIFTFPPSAGKGGGSSDDRPFVIQGASTAEFRCFLRVVYHRGASPPKYSFGKDEWFSILNLSTQWSFSAIRDVAIHELQTNGVIAEMPHIEVINMSKRFKVREWLLLGYKGFVLDAKKVSNDDAEMLGWETAYRVLQLREDFYDLSLASQRVGPQDSTLHTSHIATETTKLMVRIEQVFLDELIADGHELESKPESGAKSAVVLGPSESDSQNDSDSGLQVAPKRRRQGV